MSRVRENRPRTRVESHIEIDDLRRAVSDLIAKKPERAAIIVTAWLKEPAPAFTQAKKTG